MHKDHPAYHWLTFGTLRYPTVRIVLYSLADARAIWLYYPAMPELYCYLLLPPLCFVCLCSSCVSMCFFSIALYLFCDPCLSQFYPSSSPQSHLRFLLFIYPGDIRTLHGPGSSHALSIMSIQIKCFALLSVLEFLFPFVFTVHDSPFILTLVIPFFDCT